MRSFFVSAVIVSALGAACSFHLGGETDGQHGNAEFSYSNCFLGCTTTTPMMLDDEEHVSVSGSIPNGASVTTSAQSIVHVKSASRSCCTADRDGGGTCRTIGVGDACDDGETASLDVIVDAPAEGTSDLIVKNADGSIWDSVTLSVERAASLGFSCGSTTPVDLPRGGTCAVTWEATGANGAPLMSTAGVHLTSSDGTVAAFVAFLGNPQADVQATPQLFGNASMEAIAPGDATLTASGGGRSETLAVHVEP